MSTVRFRTVSQVALKFAAGVGGKGICANVGQHLVGLTQLLARVDAPVVASQPLSVHQMGTGKVNGDVGLGEPLDGLQK